MDRWCSWCKLADMDWAFPQQGSTSVQILLTTIRDCDNRRIGIGGRSGHIDDNLIHWAVNVFRPPQHACVAASKGKFFLWNLKVANSLKNYRLNAINQISLLHAARREDPSMAVLFLTDFQIALPCFLIMSSSVEWLFYDVS